MSDHSGFSDVWGRANHWSGSIGLECLTGGGATPVLAQLILV
jgi:hypothetical protein